jgi:hypothetical protein
VNSFALTMVAMRDARFIHDVLMPFSHIRKIVMVSTAPWGDRHDRVDNTDLLVALKAHNCEVHEGYWETEEEQRNEAMSYVNEDYAWVVDTDEVYQPDQVDAAMSFVSKNHRGDVFYIAQNIYWKTPRYKVEVDHWYAGVAIVRKTVRFTDKRNFDSALCNVVRIPEATAICDHMSFVGDDEIMSEKLKYNGHRSEFRKDWFEEVWKKWTPGMTDIHPGRAATFRRAVPC